MTAEAETYGPRPGNAAQVAAGDWRMLLGVPGGALMQVCHPVIGAGVADHSTYQADPVGRARRSIWPTLAMVLIEDAGYGADMRELHRGIRGKDHHGRGYHAWNPEAAFWVCATIVYASEAVARFFGTPQTLEERVETFHAWRRAGLAFGIPAEKVPATYEEYLVWFQQVLDEKVENHPSAHELIDGIRRPPAPRHVPAVIWWPVASVAGRAGRLVTLGLLPEQLRALLEVPWTARDQRRFLRFGRAVRVVNRLVPGRWRNLNGYIVDRFETQIRAHVAHGAELGIAPTLAAQRAEDAVPA